MIQLVMGIRASETPGSVTIMCEGESMDIPIPMVGRFGRFIAGESKRLKEWDANRHGSQPADALKKAKPPQKRSKRAPK